MSERNPVAQLPAQQKAILGTAVVALLLVVAAGTAFWYGKQSASNANDSTTSTQNTNDSATTDSGEANSAAKIAGKVVKVLGDSIEINTGTGETTRTVTAIIGKATELRKIDYRSIPKTGVGDGVPLKKDEITTGASVAIAAEDVSSNKIEASKVTLLIYP